MPLIKLKGLTFGIRVDPPGKPPLLLMHGLLSSRNHWLLNLAALRSRFRLIVAELPGHGETPGCIDPARLHPDALVEELDVARERLGITQWFMCGQSFGAGITLRYALRHPHAVAAQIWTNGNRVLNEKPGPEMLAEDDARCSRLGAGGVEALRRETFHPCHGRRFEPAIRDLLSREADACDISTVIGIIRHCLPALSLRDQFSDTSVPTLLINGRLEGRFQRMRDLALRLLPGLEVADLPGGHAINIERPDLFESSAIAFLERHAVTP